MPKLKVTEMLPDFLYDTPFEKGMKISESVKKESKTVILFLRYYGCTMCQYDMHQLAVNYEKITANGGQIYVVLQSESEKLAAQIQKKETFPFEIICDPKQELYRLFEIEPASSMGKLLDAKSVVKAVKATAKGYKHGDYEGEELQLPAAFVVDKNMRILYVHYGKSAADIPTVEQLRDLLK